MGAERRVEPLDVVIAVAIGLVTAVEIWAPDFAPGTSTVTGPKSWLVLTGLFMSAPLAFRRTNPLLACGLVFGGACAQSLITSSESLSALAALLLASYSVAAFSRTREAAIGAVLVVTTSIVIGGSDLVFVLMLLAGAWIVGLIVGQRSHQVEDLQTDRQVLLRERHEAATRGADEERRRIARELHDVVAHRVLLMVVQAQAADVHLDTSPSKAREAIRAVDEAGREALAELRALLGLLHHEDPDSTDGIDLTPSPGLADIDALVARAKTAGMEISLEYEGQPRTVPDAVGAAAYRVVQESITNVLKHGHHAATQVRVGFSGDRLSLIVTDDGPGSDAGDAEPGYGLAGMRERVDFVGGTLVAGPEPGGGFKVYACLPLPEADQ